MCNQLLLQFSMDHFETMHTCCGYIEDVHVNFCRRKNNFDKITAFSTLNKFEVSLQRRVASLCNQLLPEFASNHFGTLLRYYKHIEDVHATFSKQKISLFLQNYGILDLDNFQVWLQYGVAPFLTLYGIEFV